MRNEYFSGGLKVPEPPTQADSLKIAWVRKYLDDDKCGKWKQVMKPKLTVADNLTLFHCSISEADLGAVVRDKFWIETVQAWQKLVRGTAVSGMSILNEPLWFNKELGLWRVRCLPDDEDSSSSGPKMPFDVARTTKILRDVT